MTPIQVIYNYLDSLHFEYEAGKYWYGINATWTGPDGSTQPSPILQMRLLEEEKAQPNQRMLLIKTVSAGSGTRFTSDPVFVFAVMGKAGEPPIFAETYAELLYAALLRFDESGCVISTKPVGRIGGPYKQASGRCIYDMEFIISVDSGIMV